MGKTFTKTLSLIAYDNALTERTDDFYLRVKTQKESMGIEDIAREVAAQLGKYSEKEIAFILETAEQVRCDATVSGYIVATPFCVSTPAAKGVVLKNELSQPIDHDKVKAYANITPGTALRKAIEDCKLEIFTQPAVTGPLLNGAVAQTKSATGEVITRVPMPGKAFTLKGRNIKLAGTDPSVGITFTSVENPETKVFIPAEEVTVNEPTTLIFVLPTEISEGAWQVAVTTQYSNGSFTTKAPRTTQMDEPIVIGELSTDPDTPDGGDEGGEEEKPFG